MPNGNIEDKEELRKKLKILLAKVWALLNSDEFDLDNKEHSKLWTDMVNTAVKLHKIVQPKHHKYMLENRGVPPDDPEFYNHIHPIEDLLAYMDNPHANDDPEDQTIGHEFKIRVFSRRWGKMCCLRRVRAPRIWRHLPGYTLCQMYA